MAKKGNGKNGKKRNYNSIHKPMVLPVPVGMALMTGDERWKEEECFLTKNDKAAQRRIYRLTRRRHGRSQPDLVAGFLSEPPITPEDELIKKEENPPEYSQPARFTRNYIRVLVNLTPKKFRKERSLPKGRGVLVQAISAPKSYHQEGFIPQTAVI